MIRGYLDRMFRRRDTATKSAVSIISTSNATAASEIPSLVDAARYVERPVFIPPSLYDDLVRQGIDMAPYLKRQPIPVAR